MYKKYILNLDDLFVNRIMLGNFQADYLEYYEKMKHKNLQNNKNSFSIINNSKTDLLGKIVIDGGLLQQVIYPVEKYDIFISHSGLDSDEAIALAGWLEKTFGLKVFVDSCVWGTLEELEEYMALEMIEEVDEIRQNAHMILANSLSNLMQNSECILFLNSDNFSIDSELRQTFSPWIAYELGQAVIMKEEEPSYIKMYYKNKNAIIEKRMFDARPKCECLIAHKFNENIKDIKIITSNDLLRWNREYNRENDNIINKHPILGLYNIIESK